jgi:hypothetical protein
MGGASPSSIADIGGLVARGDGTAAPKFGFRSAVAEPRPSDLANPGALGPLGTRGEEIDGAPLTLGVNGGGAVPELNSAQRGHLRFVSVHGVRCAAWLE